MQMTGYYNWIKIFSFLSPDDIFSCDHVCQQFRNILSSNNDSIKAMFEDFTYKSLHHLCWYTERIKILKIERINIKDYDALLNAQDIENMINGLELKALKIIHSNFKFKPQVLERLTNLEELELGTKCIKQDQLSYFQNIKHLSIQPEKFKLSLGLLYLKNLESLQLRSIRLDYYSLIKVLEQNFDTLKQLYLESEQFDRYKMNKIISSLNQETLTTLHLFYFEDYQDEHLFQLISFKHLNNISIRKADIYNSFTFVKFLQFKSFLRVNFEQCDQFNDECLDILISSSPQLIYINIAWTQCTNEPVSKLLLNCLYLQEVNLAGMKQLTDNCFPEQNTWDKILRNCRALSFNKCNNVSDQILKKLKSCKQHIVITNYHDVEM